MVITCSQCDLFGICQSLGLNSPNNEGLKFQCVSQIEIQPGEELYSADNSQHKIYAVRKGLLSGHDPIDNHITSFFLPGEIVGLESAAEGSHINTVLASKTSCNLCVLDLDKSSTEEIAFQREMSIALRNKLVQQQHSATNNMHTAEQRFSSFLLDIMRRRKQHHFDESQFHLPISQEEIANYLGLAVATLSRIIKKLQRMEIFSMNKRNYVIHDIERLQMITASVE